MKTFSKCLAIVLAAAGVASFAGCSKGTTNYKTATTANWNVRTSTSVENDSFAFWQKNKETATYSITFKDGSNAGYKVSYNTSVATYSTSFYMLAEYDWSTDTIEDYRTEESEKEPVYVYETSLTISGIYQIKPEGAAKEFEDEIKTVSYFRPAGKNLQPVYSYQKIKNTSPAALTASNINSAYVQVDEEYKTYYNKRCSQSIVQQYSRAEGNSSEYVLKSTKKIGLSSAYSNFDNSQLRAAVRAFTLSGGASRSFRVLTPQNGSLQSVTASVTSPVELNTTDDSQIIFALDNAPNDYIFFDGTVADKKEGEKNRTYRYNAVSLSVNQSLKGASPTLWYSTVENNNVNSTRCVLLKMSTPLSFGLGTLTYTLKTLNVEKITQG
ncbi:MAG: hypothetical protein K2K04_06080 [Clostridia bacterium]|nr:hypothetical protein [Clostridia bacterium]